MGQFRDYSHALWRAALEPLPIFGQVGFDVGTYYSYNLIVRFEWDEGKRRANVRKHGIDFVDVEAVFAGTIVTVVDDRFHYDEERFVTLGLLNGRVVVVAHTENPRGDPDHLSSKGDQE